jgi:hypothetical protein
MSGKLRVHFPLLLPVESAPAGMTVARPAREKDAGSIPENPQRLQSHLAHVDGMRPGCPAGQFVSAGDALDPGANSTVYVLTVQADGKVLVRGECAPGGPRSSFVQARRPSNR